jgi:inorganic triphosphatase YgiF
MPAEEIELKLGLAPAALAGLGRRLARMTGQPLVARPLTSLYLDTADHALAGAGIAWRLRQTEGAWIQSLKAGRKALGGFQHSRECEAALDRPQADSAAITDPALAREVAECLAGAPLLPWFETHVVRRTARLELPGGIVEVALDRGEIRAGRRREAISEVEFELVAGSPEVLFAAARMLVGTLPAKLALPSKADRGAALAAGLPHRPAPRSSRPERPRPRSPAAGQVDRLLDGFARAVAANLDLVHASPAPEGPHQLRIALRRLRVLLTLYRPLFAADLADSLRLQARDMGRILAPLRDADVLAGELLAPRASPALAQALETWRTDTRAGVRAALVAQGAGAFAIRLLELAALGGWQRPGSRARLAAPHAEAAAPAILRLWKRLRRQGRALALLSAEERHEFRKTAKKLRYALEQVEEGAGRAAFVQALKRLQEDLGKLNDLEVLGRFHPQLGAPSLDVELEELKAQLSPDGHARFDLLMGRACRHYRALAALPLPVPARSAVRLLRLHGSAGGGD